MRCPEGSKRQEGKPVVGLKLHDRDLALVAERGGVEEEVLEASGRNRDQHPEGVLAYVLEAVGDTAGQHRGRSGRRLEGLLAAADADAALEGRL